MIFAAVNWLSISINLLLVVFVIVCLLMALLILMQRPKQEGLGAAFGGGVTDQVFGARTTNVLQKGTVYLGSMFFILSLTLAILISKQSQKKSLLEPEKPVAEEASNEGTEVDTVVEETSEEPKSLVDELSEETEEIIEETPVPETAPEDDASTEEPATETPSPAANEADKPE